MTEIKLYSNILVTCNDCGRNLWDISSFDFDQLFVDCCPRCKSKLEVEIESLEAKIKELEESK